MGSQFKGCRKWEESFWCKNSDMCYKWWVGGERVMEASSLGDIHRWKHRRRGGVLKGKGWWIRFWAKFHCRFIGNNAKPHSVFYAHAVMAHLWITWSLSAPHSWWFQSMCEEGFTPLLPSHLSFRSNLCFLPWVCLGLSIILCIGNR